jgi:hypothetical protein
MNSRPAISRAYGTYRNPIYSRGFLVMQDGGMVTAAARGGPLDGLRIAVQHVWTLGRNLELAGSPYVLETDEHGFVLKWAVTQEGAK